MLRRDRLAEGDDVFREVTRTLVTCLSPTFCLVAALCTVEPYDLKDEVVVIITATLFTQPWLHDGHCARYFVFPGVHTITLQDKSHFKFI